MDGSKVYVKVNVDFMPGGTGFRYTCLIYGREHYLYYEENYRWFVEAGR